jgi:hypothetical protein
MNPIDKMMTDINQAAVSNSPTTLVQGNTNKSTLSATAEDDDDATLTTSNYY